jgi:pimeloyl-ACP methyl ester carboxylesterase
LHGNSSCSDVFERVWTLLLDRDHTLLACDLPGHGAARDASEPHTTYTLPGYAAAVRELLDAAGLRQALAIGWSLGGHIAMEAMVSDRRLCAGMVIGSPPGKPSLETFTAAFSADPLTLLAGKPDFSNTDARAYVCAMLGTTDPDPHLLAMARRTDGRARERLIASVVECVGADQRLAYASPSQRLCVVVGAQDPFVNLDYFASLDCTNLWGGKVHVLPGEGHAPHLRPSPDFVALVLRFVAAAEVNQQDQ